MRNNRFTSVGNVAAVAAAVTAAATACASSGTVGSGTQAAGSGSGAGNGSAQSMTLLAKMTAPQAVAAASKAVAAKQSAKVHMSIESPMFDETADGAMSFGSDLAMDLQVSMSSSNAQTNAAMAQMGRMEMRMTGMVAYLDMGNSPQLKSALQGKQWMKIDFNNLAGVPMLSNFSFMKDIGKNNDPSVKLKGLLASPNLKKVGEEQRNGVQTLHFAGTLDMGAVAKASAGSGLTQQDLDSIESTSKAAGITSTTYDVWVDGNGLPVEIKFSEKATLGAVSGDVTYSDWGTPVTVSAPPADQTVDVAELLKSQGAS
jgi:hypothetical protein